MQQISRKYDYVFFEFKFMFEIFLSRVGIDLTVPVILQVHKIARTENLV